MPKMKIYYWFENRKASSNSVYANGNQLLFIEYLRIMFHGQIAT